MGLRLGRMAGRTGQNQIRPYPSYSCRAVVNPGGGGRLEYAAQLPLTGSNSYSKMVPRYRQPAFPAASEVRNASAETPVCFDNWRVARNRGKTTHCRKRSRCIG